MEIAGGDRCRAQKSKCSRDVGEILCRLRLRAAEYTQRKCSRIFNLMHVSVVPLTKIKVLAVEAQVRAGEVRAGKEFVEARIRRIAINITIVIQSFADGETHLAVA